MTEPVFPWHAQQHMALDFRQAWVPPKLKIRDFLYFKIGKLGRIFKIVQSKNLQESGATNVYNLK